VGLVEVAVVTKSQQAERARAETGAGGIYAHELPDLYAALGGSLRRLLTDADTADLERLKL
jgi:hypothetical protein